MSPSEQERRCASAVSRYLGEQTARQWWPLEWLDEGRDAEPSPDVLLSDGTDRIAVEITQLTAGKRFDDYNYALSSLHRRLAPDPVRNLTLTPPPELDIPLDRKLIHSLKGPIRTAANDLPVGDWGTILFPRRAMVKHVGRHVVSFISCLHAQTDHLEEASRQVDGIYFLQDGGTPDHQFLTKERRQMFHEDLVRACQKSKRAGQAVVEWFEEWQIYRGEDSTDGQGGVSVVGAAVDYQEAAATQSVEKAIGHAKGKLKTKDWGRRAAVALDAGENRSPIPLETFERAINRLTACRVSPIDVVFLVVGDEMRLCRHFGR